MNISQTEEEYEIYDIPGTLKDTELSIENSHLEKLKDTELSIENSHLDKLKDTELSIENNIENNIENKVNYKDLERLSNEIDGLSKNHHIEIAKILKTNNVKLSENNNGIFVNLNNLNNSTIIEIKTYIGFLKEQNNYIDIDEDIKNKLENIYFKDT